VSADGSRLPPIDPDALDPEQRRVYEAIAGSRGRVAGPFAVLLHSPQLADRVQQLGAHLRYDGALERRLAELAVLITADAWSCAFEWSAHEPIARAAGLSDAAIGGVRAGLPPGDADDRLAAVFDYARQLATTGDVADATHARVLSLFGLEQTVELTVLVGYYTLLAMTLNAHRVAPVEG